MAVFQARLAVYSSVMKESERLRAFVRVAELGNFSSAAASLGLPKANVSVAVQALETELGVRLFHRTTRSVRLTADGHTALERARELLTNLEDWSQLFTKDGVELRGRLRVDMPVTIARDVVIPQLPAFLQRHPRLALELSSTDRFVDVVAEGFDCVLRIGPRTDSSLIARPVGAYRVINCVGREYLALHGRPNTLSDLPNHRLVLYSAKFGSRPSGFEYVDPKTGKEHAIPMPGALTVNSVASYIAAAAAGLGIVQVPELGMRERLRTGEFVEVLSDWRPAPMPITLLYPHRRHLPVRVRAFMDWLTELLQVRLNHQDA